MSGSIGNILIGRNTGSAAGDLYDNVIIGNDAGNQLTGSSNILIGKNVGGQGSVVSDNVMIGAYAGFYNSGSGNVFIGNYAGYDEDSHNKLYIDNSSTNRPLIYGDFETDMLRFNSYASINSPPSDQYRLQIVEDRLSNYSSALYVQHTATAGAGTAVYGLAGSTGVYGEASMSGSGGRYGVQGWGYNGTFNYGVSGYAFGGSYNYGVYGYASGNENYAVYASGNLAYTGSLIAASDGRLKEDVTAMEPALDRLMRVKARSYRYRSEGMAKNFSLPDQAQYGFVAQELEEVFPELVVEVNQPLRSMPGEEAKEDVQSYKGVKYMEMIPVLLRAIQEQQEEIDMLKQRIEELEKNR